MVNLAQGQPQWSGAMFDLVFDRSQGSIRPLMGYPGAAYLGESIHGGLGNAVLSPDLRWGIMLNSVVADDSSPAYLASTAEPGNRLTSLPIYSSAVWNSDSSAFALLSAGGDRIVVYGRKNEGDWAQLSAIEVEPSHLSRKLLAIDMLGSCIWFTYVSGEAGQTQPLMRLEWNNGRASQIGESGTFTSMFDIKAAEGPTWLLADNSRNQVIRLKLIQATGDVATDLWESSIIYSRMDGELLSVAPGSGGHYWTSWRISPMDVDGAPSYRLIRHANMDGEQAEITLDSPANSISAVPGTRFLRLQRDASTGQILYFSDEATLELFFVPAALPATGVGQ